jgi:hypothetical protein
MSDPVLTLINPGRFVTYRGRNSGRQRTVRIDRQWEVTLDGEVLGYIRYDMLTRETRTAGKRYVNSRWQSPGWTYSSDRLGRGFEAVPSTKAQCLRILTSPHRSRA